MTDTAVRPGFRPTKPRTGDGTSVTSTYTELSKRIREAGLLERTHGYYGWVAAILTLALGGAVAGARLRRAESGADCSVGHTSLTGLGVDFPAAG